MILVCVAKQTISANSPEPYCGTSVIIVDSNAIQWISTVRQSKAKQIKDTITLGNDQIQTLRWHFNLLMI